MQTFENVKSLIVVKGYHG